MLYTTLYGDKKIAELSIEARFLYTGLLAHADDDGRLEGDAVLIRSKIFPRDEKVTVANVEKWLEEIINTSLVTIYYVNKEPYLLHPNWTKYQTLRSDRKKDSKIPPPDNQVATNSQPNDGQFAAQDKVSKDKIREGKVSTGSELPDWVDRKDWELWVAYRKQAKIKNPEYTEIGRKALFKKFEIHKKDFKEIIEQSIEKGWQGLFPIKNWQKPTTAIKPAEGKYANI